MTLAIPVSNTIAGDLTVYVMCPLLVIAILGIGRWLISINAKIAVQDKALAMLVRDAMPEGRPTLREVVGDIAGDVKETKGRLRVHIANHEHRGSQ